MVIAIEWEVTLDYRHPLKEILDKKSSLSGPTAQKLTTNHCFQCVLHLIASMMREGFFPFRNEHYKRFLFNLKWKIPSLPGDLSKRNNNKHSIAQRTSALAHITRLSVHAPFRPTLLPSHSVSYLQILTWLGPRRYLLKLTFRSGWSQCTWQGGEEAIL